MFLISYSLLKTSFTIQQGPTGYCYGKSLHMGDHYYLLDIGEKYQPSENGSADFYYTFYDNATQTALKVTRSYYYSIYHCDSINSDNVNSRILPASISGSYFYPSSYSAVACMIVKVNFNVVTDASVKAFGIRKVNIGETEGIIQGQDGVYYYEYNSRNSNALSFTDQDGFAYNYLTVYIYDLTNPKTLFEYQQTFRSALKDGYNYVTIPSNYSKCLVQIENCKKETTMYIGFGDNPYPNPPSPPEPPEPTPTGKNYIFEYSGDSLYINAKDNITLNDTVYVFKSVNTSSFSGEANFGFFPMMTKYSKQTVSIYQASTIDYTNPSQTLKAISPNSYGLYNPSSGNKYLAIKSQPQTTISSSDKYGINKAYYSQGSVTSHFFFVMRNDGNEISQIKFGIDTDYQLPEITVAKMYTTYDFDKYLNAGSNITTNTDGNYYQFTNQATSSTCILELQLRTNYNIKLAINGDIPYPAPQRNDTNTTKYVKILSSQSSEYATQVEVQSLNESYNYYILRNLDEKFINESQYKYTYVSSLNTTKGFSFYQAENCGSLTENNIENSIQYLQMDQYGYTYPSGKYNCVVLKYEPDKNYINKNIDIAITKTYLQNGVVTNNFSYGFNPNSSSRVACLGSYKGRQMPNPQQLMIGNFENHNDKGHRIYIEDAQIYDGYLCYTINSSYNQAFFQAFSQETDYYILTTDGSSPYDSPYHQDTNHDDDKPSDNNNSDNDNTAVIVGCVIGGVVVVVIICAVIYIYCKKSKQQQQQQLNQQQVNQTYA